MAETKGVRRARVNIKTEDLAERTQTTSAVAEIDHLVTSQILQPETEEVVLAGDIDRDYTEQLKFNEEIVEITIAQDTSEFPRDPVPVSCNGKQVFIKRGVPTKIKRKFVECLCSPLVRVTTKQRKNNLGEDVTELNQHRSLEFPFQLQDDNPKGKEWLRQLLTRG